MVNTRIRTSRKAHNAAIAVATTTDSTSNIMMTTGRFNIRSASNANFNARLVLYVLLPSISLLLSSSSSTLSINTNIIFVSSFKPSSPTTRSIPGTGSTTTTNSALDGIIQSNNVQSNSGSSVGSVGSAGYRYNLRQRQLRANDESNSNYKLLPRLPSALYQSFETKEAETVVQSATTERETETTVNGSGVGSSSSSSSTRTGANHNDDSSNGSTISELDARVLQSLLDDKELDLKSEENLKKMLDNSNNVKEKNAASKSRESNKSGYSSTFFKTVSDNSMWNSFRAKADEVLESTKIFVQNRIERDAKLLASISLFAWERALKDVGRALPAAGETSTKVAETVKKAVYALATNSSFVENNTINGNGAEDGRPSSFLLSSTSMFNDQQQKKVPSTTTYDKLTTPRDEIQKVSESIRDILSGKTSNPSMISDRGLRSIAPAGTSTDRITERQRMAFQRRKETLLLREKESIDKKVIRVASSVTDAAWEIKREMQVEGNEAGYRSEAVRKQIEGSITSSALLEGGKNWIGKRLGSSSRGDNETPKLESSTAFERNDVVNGAAEAVTESKTYSIKDAIVVPIEPEIVVTSVKDDFVESDIVKAKPTEEAATASLNLNGEGNDLDELFEDVTGSEVNAERTRLITVLRSCLEEPDQSWLRPDLLPASISEQQTNEKDESVAPRPFFLSPDDEDDNDKKDDEMAWEETITTMVSAKNQLEAASVLDIEDKSKDDVISDLYEMQQIVETVINSVTKSAGEASAEFLRIELLGEISTLSSSQEPQENVEQQVEGKNAVVQGTHKETETDNIESAVSKVKTGVLLDDIPIKNMESSFTEQRQDQLNGSDERIIDFTEAIPTVVVADVISNEQDTGASPNVVVADVISNEEDIPFQSHNVRTNNNNKVRIPSDVDFELDTSLNLESISNNKNNNEFESDRVVYADVEVVVNGEDDIMKSVNTMNSAAVEEEEPSSKEKRENVVVRFTLRTLDVLFFVAEKSLTVGLPGILNAYDTVGQKKEVINRNGLGKEGWELLENINDAKNRY